MCSISSAMRSSPSSPRAHRGKLKLAPTACRRRRAGAALRAQSPWECAGESHFVRHRHSFRRCGVWQCRHTRERLKFGVIGRSVNEVARTAEMAKLLHREVVLASTSCAAFPPRAAFGPLSSSDRLARVSSNLAKTPSLSLPGLTGQSSNHRPSLSLTAVVTGCPLLRA